MLAYEAPSDGVTRETPRPRGELALALQEAFTVGVRLRAKRQVTSSAEAFRAHIKQLLTAADRHARRAGYDPTIVRLAIYAYIAFLDESVLNAALPIFVDWTRQPLQEEVFGDHIAGETFFRNLSELMGRQDSEELADVLEVYQLAMLLGFRGKYAANPGALRVTATSVQDRLRRVRGRPASLSPSWALPEREVIEPARDPWLRRLAIAGGVALILTVSLHVTLRHDLDERAATLEAIAMQVTQRTPVDRSTQLRASSAIAIDDNARGP